MVTNLMLLALLAVSDDPSRESPLAADQAIAIGKIEKAGGRVTVAKPELGGAVTEVQVMPGNSFDDEVLSCVKAFPQLQSLRLHRTKITDAGMANLKGLAKLRVLTIRYFGFADKGIGITDKGIAEIAGLDGLEDLDIEGTRISDDGLKHLKGMKNLKRLSLVSTQVTDAGIAQLKELPSLEGLSLGMNGNVTDDGLRYLKDLPKLKGLQLSKDFTDAGLSHVGALTNLKSLAILDCGVTDAGIESIRALTKLTSFRFWGSSFGLRKANKLTDASMAYLKEFKELDYLEILGPALITDAGFSQLSSLTKLETLQISNLSITDKGLDTIKGMSRLQSLTLSKLRITDAGLEKLKAVKSLRRLYILQCGVTQAGVDDLTKSVPGLTVIYH